VHGELVVPNPAEAFRDDDPLVKAYPWLFVSDEIEEATAAPGEKRRGRPKMPRDEHGNVIR
jgi:hypothetical protein